MTEITQPHDHFFRRTFSDPDIVEDILFNNLPQIATHLVPGSLGNTGESFVTPELREYVSDMLYRAQLKRGTGAYLYLLFEHKSHPEPRVAFDLLRYMVRIWERIRDQGASERLPHVIPIVFYHGKERWNGDTNFAGLFEQIEELREYVPTFEYCLYDLSRYSENEIRGQMISRVALLSMKYIYKDDLGKEFVRICESLCGVQANQRFLDFLWSLLEYMGTASDRISEEQIRVGVRRIFPDSGGDIMQPLFVRIREEAQERGLEQGLERGREEGREEGRRIGLQEAIELALELKFGDQGLLLVPRIRDISSIEKLEQIKNTLRKADTLDQIASLL